MRRKKSDSNPILTNTLCEHVDPLWVWGKERIPFTHSLLSRAQPNTNMVIGIYQISCKSRKEWLIPQWGCTFFPVPGWSIQKTQIGKMECNSFSVYLRSLKKCIPSIDQTIRLKTKSREIHKQSCDWITQWNIRNQRMLMGTVALRFGFDDTVVREIRNHAVTHKKGMTIHDKRHQEKQY